MTEEDNKPGRAVDDAILHQQYRRALSSFEGIILSEIELTRTLGNRLNYAIQAGTLSWPPSPSPSPCCSLP